MAGATDPPSPSREGPPALAASPPPTIAAALLPRPRPSGMALWQRTEKLVRCPARCATAAAARYTRLVTSSGRVPSPCPLTTTAGEADTCACTVLYTVTATPSASNAGPQFAIVAGTRTLTIQ